MTRNDDILNVEFWEAAWHDFLVHKVGKNKNAQVKRWNGRAERYARRTGGEQGRRRVDQVFDFLCMEGVLNETLTILDVGSGPGSFAIPFAESGHTVMALDPSQNMLDILLEKQTPGISGRISGVCGLWEEIDERKLGWEKEFDLVFASMSPGVRDVGTIKKMNTCSRKWCYLSSFAGPRRYLLYEEIWLELFGKPFANHVTDIIFPFNTLYAMGYRPRLTFADTSQRREEPLEDVSKDIMDFVGESGQGESLSVLEDKICSMLEIRSVNGRVTHDIISVVGMMLWQSR